VVEQSEAVVRVAAGAVISAGRVLLARRARGQRQAGCWELPGGKLEPGESTAEALRRELEEELGLGAQGLCLRVDGPLGAAEHRYAHATIRLECLAAALVDPSGRPLRWPALDPARLAAHDATVWALPEDLPSYAIAPADLPLLPAVSAACRG
jgi:8-oxo-dGTP diphosphatase